MFQCGISTFTGTRPVGAMQGPRPYAPSLRWGIFQSTGDLCRTCTDAGRSVALRRALWVSRQQGDRESTRLDSNHSEIFDIAFWFEKKNRFFSLDTGRLHPETYQFLDKVREHS